MALIDYSMDEHVAIVTMNRDENRFNPTFLQAFLDVLDQVEEEPEARTLFKRIVTYPLITIAAINGHAFAGGAILSCAFDFRFMRSDRGFFCFPEVDLGIPFLPGMNAMLKKAMPMYMVEELQYTGNRLTAEECAQHHIITQACHVKNLMDEVLTFAKGLKKERGIIAEMKARLNQDIVHAIDIEDGPYIESGKYNIG